VSFSLHSGLRVLLFAIVLAASAPSLLQRVDGKLVARDFPIKAATFLQQHPAPGHMLNAYGWGGYLIYRLSAVEPPQKVFIFGDAALTGDHHPLHTDVEWAAESEFNGRIAHGMLLLSYCVGLVPLDPEHVLALRGFERVAFKRPVRIGDTIHVEGALESKKGLDAAPGLVVFRVPEIDRGLLRLRTTEDVFLLAWGTDSLTYRAADLESIRRWTARDADWGRLLRLHHAVRPRSRVVHGEGARGGRRGRAELRAGHVHPAGCRVRRLWDGTAHVTRRAQDEHDDPGGDTTHGRSDGGRPLSAG